MGDYTIGVEEEYQLVSSTTAELRSNARDVLAIDWSGELLPENQQTILEIGTPVCQDSYELNRELRRLRFQVASAAAAEGLSSVAAGLHPFSRWQDQVRTPGERYERVLERYGLVNRTDHIFGMHTHVAVPDGVDRVHVMNVVREFIPHLIALSASSPLYEGEDTSYASYRTILGERYPYTGTPPLFPSDESFREFVDLLLRTGAIEDEYTLYWSIRPHPEYPTVEFRMTDVCPRVEDAVAIASLCRSLVAAAVEGRIPGPAKMCSESAADAVLANNQWQAARFGLEASFVDPRLESGKQSLRDGIRRLLDALQPVTESLGDDAALADIETILQRGNGADRIRNRLSQSGDLKDLVRWLSSESVLGIGLDRRTEQREECA